MKRRMSCTGQIILWAIILAIIFAIYWTYFDPNRVPAYGPE